MRIGDKVFVRIQHMTANGVIVDLDRTQDGVDYLVKVGDGEYWIPEKDCTSVEALDKWASEPTLARGVAVAGKVWYNTLNTKAKEKECSRLVMLCGLVLIGKSSSVSSLTKTHTALR